MKSHYRCFSFKKIGSFFGFILALLVGYVLVSAANLEGSSSPVILALGDSLTAGFGVRENESYPSLLQKMLKEKGYPHRVINAGVSGDTTAGGLRRIKWLLLHKPSIVILALGANDGLRGLSTGEMYSNLKKIIRICRDHGAEVLLVGMKVPPNFGEEYSRAFEKTFSLLAKKYHLRFLPFLLEGVASKREYTQADGIHPLAPGYKIVARSVWKYLEPMLMKSSRR
ncbi:MAG: arylesterase [Nitrospinaceae bacterium]